MPKAAEGTSYCGRRPALSTILVVESISCSIIFLNAAFISTYIVWSHLILEILFVTGLVVAIAYFLGYVAGKAVRADRATTLTIIYSTGMRNIATGLVIATSYFPHETAIPIALAMLFQQPFAALTVKIFNKFFPLENEPA